MPRACPTDYHYAAEALREAPLLEAETLYVIGGLYGNPEALDEILALQAREQDAGRSVTLLFNGDFHWFDVAAPAFARIGEGVHAHPALRGNVETELARPAGSMDCGCSYPDYVEPGVPERSNAIFARLASTARAFPALHQAMRALPRLRRARVGGRHIGVLHGDPESLAGWRLAAEALTALDDPRAATAGVPQTSLACIEAWFRRADVDAFATTHTCLPFARDFLVDGRARAIVNNGSAGMPNFRGARGGLLTRISAHPVPPADSLYGKSIGGVRYDALPIAYDSQRWLERFLADWPPGSPAHVSYWRRIVEGPAFTLQQAARGNLLGSHQMPGRRLRTA